MLEERLVHEFRKHSTVLDGVLSIETEIPKLRAGTSSGIDLENKSRNPAQPALLWRALPWQKKSPDYG